MKRKHEQSVIDAFFKFMTRQADKLGRSLTRCSLDGQDTILGADYIFTNSSNFLMVEFKYERSDVKHESTKHRRLVLCQSLDLMEDWRELSLACHYISWSHKSGQERRVHFNPYYNETCNRHIFSEALELKRESPLNDFQLEAKDLVRTFLEGDLGLDYLAFEKYTNWLLSLDESGDAEVELIIDRPDEEELLLMEFKSVRDLKAWLDTTSFEPPKLRLRGPDGFSPG